MTEHQEFIRGVVKATRDEWVKEYAHIRQMMRQFGYSSALASRKSTARRIALRNADQLRAMQ